MPRVIASIPLKWIIISYFFSELLCDLFPCTCRQRRDINTRLG